MRPVGVYQLPADAEGELRPGGRLTLTSGAHVHPLELEVRSVMPDHSRLRSSYAFGVDRDGRWYGVRVELAPAP